MAKFKSVPGSEAPMGLKFDKEGYLETSDPEAVKMLSGMKFVETVEAPAAAKPAAKPADPKPEPKAPKGGK